MKNSIFEWLPHSLTPATARFEALSPCLPVQQWRQRCPLFQANRGRELQILERRANPELLVAADGEEAFRERG